VGEPKLLGRQPACFVLVAQPQESKRSLRAPGDEGRVLASHRLEEAPHLEELVQAAGDVAPQNAQASATVVQEDE
jgi:hypothetical protein